MSKMPNNWKRVALEIFKMGAYMAFPVSMFYIFNQPEIHDWMIKDDPTTKLLKSRSPAFPQEYAEAQAKKLENQQAEAK